MRLQDKMSGQRWAAGELRKKPNIDRGINLEYTN